MDIRIGKQLTQAREALGFVVEDVAHRTRVPAASIRFLESEDFSHFPNNVYAKSFLRLYCKFLNIDPAKYLAQRDGRLITHEDEVAFLEGIAVGPEFQDLEEEIPKRKISPNVITTAALILLGIPAAFLVSNIYDRPGGAAATRGSATPAEIAVPDTPSQTVSEADTPPRPLAPVAEPAIPKLPPTSAAPHQAPDRAEDAETPIGQPVASTGSGYPEN